MPAGAGTKVIVNAYSPCCDVPLVRRMVAPMFHWIIDCCRSATKSWATMNPYAPDAAAALDDPYAMPPPVEKGIMIDESGDRL